MPFKKEDREVPFDLSDVSPIKEEVESPPAVEVEVDEKAIDEDHLGETFPGAHQVEPNYKIFVPFEDFEGRINQNEFKFQKDVAVKVTIDEAATWVDAGKGYTK